eukprot:TRINITY_DN2195_c0_g1_i1.p1 TRINITY_DN2195_c0_g1~~TRINITY_DN2195_c0_g1_i1.p1  ORF type:complete len:155 (+),score=27.38 TRINITY_DN2195_c0_g1_i1:461-925(+)
MMSDKTCEKIIDLLKKCDCDCGSDLCDEKCGTGTGLGKKVREIRVDGFSRCPLGEDNLRCLVQYSTKACPVLEKLLIQGSMQKLSEGQMILLLENCKGIKNVRHPKSMSIFESLFRANNQLQLRNMELINITIKNRAEIDNLYLIPQLFPNLNL